MVLPVKFDEQTSVLFEANSLRTSSHRAAAGGSLRSVTSASSMVDDECVHDPLRGHVDAPAPATPTPTTATSVLTTKVSVGNALFAAAVAVAATALLSRK